jgi:cation diffusion facilitator CzcD-associated flavoprotein CzcO
MGLAILVLKGITVTVLDAAEETPLADLERWLEKFSAAAESADPLESSSLFSQDGFWKDILSFTGGFRTFSGPDEIGRAWHEQSPAVSVSRVRVATNRTPPRQVRRSARDVVEGYFDFDTVHGHGIGFVRLLREDNGEPKAWLLLTTLQELHGHEERTGDRRPTGVQYSQSFAGDNWLDERVAEQSFEDRDPEVVIVGGGQGGLILAARLKQMGVDALVVEKLPRVGDNWRQRYHSLTLHNQVWANSLPYMPFPETWPTFVPKDKLAGWLEAYAEAMELNVWTSTEMRRGHYDEESETWTVTLATGDGSGRTLRTRHLAMAIGGSAGVPNMPKLPGLEDFEGEIVHSSAFTSGVPYAGRNAIVVGTGTSGHDVAQDLYENGAASVTMIQRGPTCVVSLVPSGTMVYSLYSEGPPPDDIDLITAAIPYEVLRETYQWMTKRTCELDKDLLDGLRDVGFKLDFGPDNTGFHMMYLRHGGGYYINVGCSDLIADRKIGLLQDKSVEMFTRDGLETTDGESVKADLIVLATGYRNLQEGIADWLGHEVADRVGPVWGFDENRVMRNMWQRTGQPGLWIMGGSLIDARLYSRFLAVQITADLRGIALAHD